MEIIFPKPRYDEAGRPFPTLGPQICDWMEDNLVYGPGPLRGQSYVVRDEFRYLLYRAYEHFPEGYILDLGEGQTYDMTGRRCYQQVNVSLPKGSAKCLDHDTELVLKSGEIVLAKDLEAGQSVMSYDQGEVVYRKVVAVEEQPVSRRFKVSTSRGREIIVSEGHPFLVSGTQWVEAQNLKKGYQLTSVDGGFQVSLDKVTSVEEIDQGTTIGVEIEDTHVHVTNGLVTHNTELMAEVSIAEIHPEAPVRFNGYDPDAPGGLAPGRSIVSPFIPLLAPTKDQLYDLAYGATQTIATDVDPEQGLFDVKKDGIVLVGESESKIVPVAAAGQRLDGLKPTFQGIDEPHRLYEDRHRDAYRTMVNNLPKRYVDDPWQLTCTTAGDPSEPSIARDHYRLGVRMAEGEIEMPNVFFYHRGTSDENAKFDTMAHRIRALKEASGEEASKFRDLKAVASMWDDEGNDKAYLERVWCNRWVQASANAFDVEAFKDLGDERLTIPPGALVTLGFDGAVTDDSTALVVTDVKTGVQILIGIWEKPKDGEGWSVPVAEVNSLVDYCFEAYDVFSFYYDPPYWQEAGARWDEKYPGKVVEWPTRNLNRIYYAIRAYQEAIANGEIAHSGDKDLIRHIGNAGRKEVNSTDEEGKRKFRLGKLAKHRKFDAAMAAILSWQARLDAIKKGASAEDEFINHPVRLR